MFVRKILTVPKHRAILREVSEFCAGVDQQLVTDMIHTMNVKNGLGLAAPQIGVMQRIIVIDPREDRGSMDVDTPIGTAMVNPIIKARSDATCVAHECCLSIPDQECLVERNVWIEVEWLSRHWDLCTGTFYGLAARVIQHEIDHLNGRLIIDRHIKKQKPVRFWAGNK